MAEDIIQVTQHSAMYLSIPHVDNAVFEEAASVFHEISKPITSLIPSIKSDLNLPTKLFDTNLFIGKMNRMCF